MPRVQEKRHKTVCFIENGKYIIPNLSVTWLDKVIGGLSGELMVANWIYPLLSLKYLPNIIHVALNFKGKITLAASKYILLCVPLVSTYSLIRYANLACKPEKQSYSVEVNGKNVRHVYKKKSTSLRVKGLLTQCLFLGFSYLFIKGCSEFTDKDRSWLNHALIGIGAAAAIGYGSIRCLLHV